MASDLSLRSPVWRLRRLSFIAVLATVTAVLPAAPAYAVDCRNPHCYSVLRMKTLTSYYGVYTDMQAANMSPGQSSSSLPYFTLAHAWFGPTSSYANWVEIGYINGYRFDIGTVGYCTNWAAKPASGVFETHTIGCLSPDGVRRSFQISRGNAINKWNFYQNNSLVATLSNSGFWGGTGSSAGGEFYLNTSNSFANTFDMNIRVFNGSGQPVLYPFQDQTVNAGFNGISYSKSQWSWNRPCCS